MAPSALFASDLNLPGRRQGKVRDLYALPPDAQGGRVLIVASDRISAFDVVMPTPVPGKGALLTEIAAWWFGFIQRKGLARTHLLSTRVEDIPEAAFSRSTPREAVRGRVTIGRACRVVPIECVVRGYLEGSGFAEYQASGSVCGVRLPGNLRRCERLPEPIFTPATKAEHGHDQNVPFEAAAAQVGASLLERLRSTSLAIYSAAAAHARDRGIIIADTKFEFGLDSKNEPVLIDEALTPDSSRFWPADRYEPGRPQASFDKQFLREYLQGLVDAGQWRKEPPGPELPAPIVEQTLAKYREARDRLCIG